MSDLESFSPSEGAEGVDSGALERLREQMKKASAQMKRDQQQEAKQKKQEDNLYEVLIAFIRELGPGNQLVALIAKCVAHNISAEMILALISLIFPTVQKLIGIEMVSPNSKVITEAQSKALINPKVSRQDLPVHIRINIDTWLKTINSTAFLNPVRNAKTMASQSNPEKACGAFHNIIAYVAQEYLEKEKIDFNAQNVLNFVVVFADNLLQRLQMHNESTKEIETKEDGDS